MIPLIYLALGLILIMMEFLMPSVVMGVAGGALVIISIVLFAMQANSLWLVALYLIGIVVVLVYLIKFAIWRIRTAKPSRSLYSDSSQTGYVASGFDASAIGKTGVVVTDLKPGGHILVEGKRQQAISQGGYITKGTEVIVLSGQEESLIVKPKKDTA